MEKGGLNNISEQKKKMKKHSKFFIKHEKKVKSLLEELTQREMESTELKISELVKQQRSNLAALRSLKAQAVEQPVHRPKVHYDLFQPLSNTERNKDKENQCHPGQEGSSELHLFSQKSREKMSTCDHIKDMLTERSNRGGQRGQEHCLLPELSSLKISKRNSIQNCVEDEQKTGRPSHQITELAIIEEKVGGCRNGRPPNPLKALRLQKHRSLATAQP